MEDTAMAVRQFILNQRRVNFHFRNEKGLNRSDMEVLMYANTVVCFNAYDVQLYFEQINLQQIRL